MKRFILLLSIVISINIQAQKNTPCIIYKMNPSEGKDAFVHSLNYMQDSNLCCQPQMPAIASTFNGTPGVTRALFDFQIGIYAQSVTVDSAILSLYAYNFAMGAALGQHSVISGFNEGWIERVITTWEENTVTWLNQPQTTQLNRVAVPASFSPSQNYPHIDVTDLVQDMIDLPQSSFGFMLRLANENYYRGLNFCSSDNPVDSLRPRLKVCYNTSTNLGGYQIIKENMPFAFPNPFNNSQLNIEKNGHNILNIRGYNIIGQEILNINSIPEPQVFSINLEVGPGIYNLLFTFEDGSVYVEKIVRSE